MKRYIITPTASRNPFVFTNIESDPHCHTNPPKIQNLTKNQLETSINNSMQTSIFAEYSNKNSKKPLKNIPLICCPFQNKLKIFKIQPIECTASEKDSLPSKKINPNTKEPHVVQIRPDKYQYKEPPSSTYKNQNLLKYTHKSKKKQIQREVAIHWNNVIK